MMIISNSLQEKSVQKLSSKMSDGCVQKMSYSSRKRPENRNISDVEVSRCRPEMSRRFWPPRPEYCNFPDVFWTCRTFSGHSRTFLTTISGHSLFIGQIEYKHETFHYSLMLLLLTDRISK
jgi:hypothetical protein